MSPSVAIQGGGVSGGGPQGPRLATSFPPRGRGAALHNRQRSHDQQFEVFLQGEEEYFTEMALAMSLSAGGQSPPGGRGGAGEARGLPGTPQGASPVHERGPGGREADLGRGGGGAETVGR